MYAGTKKRILMIDAEANCLTEKTFYKALKHARAHIQDLIDAQLRIADEAKRAKEPEGEEVHAVADKTSPQFYINPQVVEWARTLGQAELEGIYLQSGHTKASRNAAVRAWRHRVMDQLQNDHPELQDNLGYDKERLEEVLSKLQRDTMHLLAIHRNSRVDGRNPSQVRPLMADTDYLPGVHGSAVFERGETQVLCTATLGPKRLRRKKDRTTGEELDEPLLLQYEFPPFCKGEVGQMLLNRRESGHSMLARKALLPVLPSIEDFPYSLRVVSTVTESSGSSSMATVCGASLALRDAGVPLKEPVAGVTCGLMSSSDPATGKLLDYQLLVDITGMEDALGDMDLKVAGSRGGITACQLDVKLSPSTISSGVPFKIIKKALEKANGARNYVLDIMGLEQDAPRPHLKPSAPINVNEPIPLEFLHAAIGPSGTRIEALQRRSGCDLVVTAEGILEISAPSSAALEEVREHLRLVCSDWTIEKEYDVEIMRVTDMGVVVMYKHAREGYVTTNHLTNAYTANPRLLGLQVGDVIRVRCIGQDAGGRYVLSRKPFLAINQRAEWDKDYTSRRRASERKPLPPNSTEW